MSRTTDISNWIDAHITWLGQSAFKIKTESGIIIYLDAFRMKSADEKADYYFSTHEHMDHFNPKLIKKLRKETTHVVVPTAMKTNGKDENLATDTISPGEEKVIGKLKVKALPSYNITKKNHPESRAYVAYVIIIDGYTIYHAGDTDLIPEMTDLKPDIAMLPVGGSFTMDWREAARAAELIKPLIVIPMHYGLIPFTKKNGKRFSNYWEGTVKILNK